MAGPGHGGPALVAACWLEGTYSEIYPEVSLDRAGIGRLFRQFSTPGISQPCLGHHAGIDPRRR